MLYFMVILVFFRFDFEVGYLIFMWKRFVFKIYNNVLRKKKYLYCVCYNLKYVFYV